MLQQAEAAYAAEKYAEAVDFANQAIDAGHVPAQVQLGVWSLVGTEELRDVERGFSLISEAAKASDLKAMRLMTNLYAMGMGCETDWKRAQSWLIKCAKAGDASSLTQVALLLRRQPRLTALRRTFYYSAAIAGYHCAANLLGRDLLDGGDPAEASLGIGWIMAAADGGDPAALSLAPKFVGEKMRKPAAPDLVQRIPWQDLKRLLMLPHKEPLPTPVSLCETPKVVHSPGLIRSDIADYLMATAAPLLQPATVYDSESGEVLDQTRSNSFVNFRLLEADIVSLSVNARIMQALDHPVSQGDALSLLHYRPGQQYAPHFDFFDPAFPAHQPYLQEGGQRVKTGLLYLNDDYEGGVTRFHEANIDFRGDIGDFLQFDNVDGEGNPDRQSLHSGEPPVSGEKWILSKWARLKPVSG